MTPAAKPALLCVDDEPLVLEGLTLHLRRAFTLTTATSGAAGLEILKEKGSFAIVMSDMRMPGMSGAEFLAKVREQWPNTVRVLLTGQSDLQSAVAAVNEGQIFRFLTKPCPPDVLLGALGGAAKQHELLLSERVLLILRDNLFTKNGMLLVPKGNEVTPALIERIANFSRKMGVREPIPVTVPAAPAPAKS